MLRYWPEWDWVSAITLPKNRPNLGDKENDDNPIQNAGN
jgi:hypothetical protein